MDTVITDPDDPALTRLFTDYTDSAWQLLTLPYYNHPHEQPAFDHYRNGTTPTSWAHTWTTDTVTNAVAADKDIGRVHVIERTTTDNKLTLSDYLRFTLHRYEAAKAAGETIRIAWTKPGSWPRHIGTPGDDFWLFDEHTDHGIVVKQQYSANGTFQQATISHDPAKIRRATKTKRAALAASKLFYP